MHCLGHPLPVFQKVRKSCMYVCANLSTLPATDKRIKRLQRIQREDEVCQHLITFCTEGWPNKNRVPGILKPYVTGFRKTDHSVTIDIARNTDLKY